MVRTKDQKCNQSGVYEVRKLLVVFNTCGITRETKYQVEQYKRGIRSILSQDFDDLQVIVSCCKNSDLMISLLREEFPQVPFYLIHDVLPINVTFNAACLKGRQEFGEFEGYMYVDSGITFNTKNDLTNLFHVFKSGQNGMVAARTSTDTGLFQWFGIGNGPLDTSKDHLLFQDGDFVIPIGKTVNLHAQIFSNRLLEEYGYLIPDIYAGFCTESVFSFVCAAIDTRFVLSENVVVDHVHGMDEGSSGFLPLTWLKKGGMPYDHPFLVPSVMDIAKAGHEFGFGYEECSRKVMHKPEKFVDGFSVDRRLKDFIRQYQFVGNLGIFDYNKINCGWVV